MQLIEKKLKKIKILELFTKKVDKFKIFFIKEKLQSGLAFIVKK